MGATLQSKITNAEGEFIVMTKSSGFFFARASRSSVMPYRVEDFLASPGFQIQYNTGDARVLAEWHEMICRVLESGSFHSLCEGAARSCFPYPAGKEHLHEHVKRFV